ncbi:MAG: hypothetical protein VKL01_03495 [Limnothrix sp.]|nr:hypothetical protein [Limnothrix sp.]
MGQSPPWQHLRSRGISGILGDRVLNPTQFCAPVHPPRRINRPPD